MYSLQAGIEGATGAAEKRGEAVSKAEAKVNRARESYQETLNQLVQLEGANIEVQETVRKTLERRAKTDEGARQALLDRAAAEQKAKDIYADVLNELEILRAQGFDKELEQINQNYEERLTLLTAQYGAESQEVKDLLELKNAEIAEAQAAFDQQQKDDAQKAIDDRLALVDAGS